MNLKKYLSSLKRYIAISCLIFIIGFLWGYSSANTSPQEAQDVFIQLKRRFLPILQTSSISQFLFIFLNNSAIAFGEIILGLGFGIFSLITSFLNSLLLGIVVFVASGKIGWFKTLFLLLPHGIFELPAMITSCAIGLRLGKVVFDKLFKKKGELKEEIKKALNFYFKFIIPLLLLAAMIEVILGIVALK